MADFGKHFFKAFIVPILLCVCTQTYTYRLESRQNNVCANHAMGEFVENPQNCHLFYWCDENGRAVSASCPLNMLFNPQSKLCDTPANVQCITKPLAVIATTTESSAVSTLFAMKQYCLNAYNQETKSDSLIFLPHPNKCNQYYMCYYGQALLQQCSTDLQWNSRIGKCDLPTNTKCQAEGERISLPIAPTKLSPMSGILCPVYGQHIFPHMQRCNMFIYCVKGHAILQQCPFNQYFDVETSRCKLRKTAVCIKDLNLEIRQNRV